MFIKNCFLGLYLLVIGVSETADGRVRLFSSDDTKGSTTSAHFGNRWNELVKNSLDLEDKEAAVYGTHSLRKGAASYIGELISGPSITTQANRGGWQIHSQMKNYFYCVDGGKENALYFEIKFIECWF